MTIQGQEDQVKLSFSANQFSAKSPGLLLAVDQQTDQQNRVGGYVFEVETVNLSKNTIFTVGLVTRNKLIYFEDNDIAEKSKSYNIKVTHFSSDPNAPIEVFSLIHLR